jgi:serine protease Do
MFKRNRLALATVSGLLGAAMLGTAIGPAMAETPATVNPPTTAATAVPPPAAPPVVAAGSLLELTTLIKQNSAAVVSINVEGKRAGKYAGLPDDLELPPELKRFFRGLPQGDDSDEGSMRAEGSGFIISQDGYIVTNAHVVDDAKTVTIGLPDKRELPAEIVGTDKLSDVALLKVKADNLPVVQLGNSDTLEVGQWVVAIGAPFGLDHSATQGIVSALSRSLPDGTYVPFIQTDVAVNPGNSGGPLFDLGGRVVGVNSQIYSRSGGYMGISFAIPVNVVKKVADDLKSKGSVSRGWLGVAIQDMDQDLAKSFNLAQPTGALVSSVELDSPADKAGIQAGDVITGFGTGAVKSASDLPLLVGNTPVGTSVAVKILRAGAEKTMDVTVEQLTEKGAKGGKHKAVADAGKGSLGIVVADLSEQQRKENNLRDEGVLIQDVVSGSVAENAGLKQGDIIVSVNNSPVHSAEELRSAVTAAPQDKPLALLVVQDGQTRFLAINKP